MMGLLAGFRVTLSDFNSFAFKISDCEITLKTCILTISSMRSSGPMYGLLLGWFLAMMSSNSETKSFALLGPDPELDLEPEFER